MNNVTIESSVEQERTPPWLLPAVAALLTLLLFGDSLLVPGRVPVSMVSDLRTQYLPWREFAFSQIRSGHFPLWNPYAFCGTPFFADPQSALLYPPNWLNLFLSPERAASSIVALHFFMAIVFAGIFFRSRGVSRLAAILGGILYACSGPIITNLRPGHLPLLCSAAWGPLLFRCADGLFESDRMRRRRWTLIGVGVVAMLALDGYPQFAYYSALAVGLYVLLRLRLSPPSPSPGTPGEGRGGGLRASIGVLANLILMFAAGWAIAAVQLLSSAQAAAESVRAAGLSYNAAAEYSLPPENLLTLIIPGLFGDAAHLLYYGRWYWWETCLFIGPAAAILAALACRDRRRAGLAMGMTLVLILLAVGSYTPLFTALYDWLPGFSHFRAAARFGIFAVMFVSLLAAMGWDVLEKGSRRPVVIGALVAAAILLIAALWANNTESSGRGDFTRIIHSLAATHQTMEAVPLTDAAFPAKAASFAAGEFALSAVAMLIAGAIVAASKPGRAGPAAAIFAIAAGQVIWFAVSQRETSDQYPPLPTAWADEMAHLNSSDRILLPSNLWAEIGDSAGFHNVAGSNPLVLNRTARFLSAVQSGTEADAGNVGLNYPIRIASPLYRLLRCSLILPGKSGGPTYPVADPLPRLLLLSHVIRAADADSALAAVLADGFDPSQSVILEDSPQTKGDANLYLSSTGFRPQNSQQTGSVRLIHETTDEMEIEADIPTPQILLITDAYSAGWQVTPLPGATQKDYQVLPGDYCLRAIPLAAGHHHFFLAYQPSGYTAGKWISMLALAGYVTAAAFVFNRRKGTAPCENR